MIAVVNWWPRSTHPGRDGSVAWYRGSMWNRHYYKVTGTDSCGCEFAAAISHLPGYCSMKGTYPTGAKREITKVMVKGHQDGCDIDRKDVVEGVYYAPDGTEVGRVKDGTGTIKYCRPDGTNEAEYTLLFGKVVREKHWRRNDVLQSERSFSNGLLAGECIDYHADGSIRCRSHYLNGRCIQAEWYDQAGTVIQTFSLNREEPSPTPRP